MMGAFSVHKKSHEFRWDLKALTYQGSKLTFILLSLVLEQDLWSREINTH